jgi:hypothetical protein
MQYILLIYSTEGNAPQPGTDEFGPYMQAYTAFSQSGSPSAATAW